MSFDKQVSETCKARYRLHTGACVNLVLFTYYLLTWKKMDVQMMIINNEKSQELCLCNNC